MPFSHPHEKSDSGFERFAEAVSNFTTRWLCNGTGEVEEAVGGG
jgi:hypothetical protein